MYGSSVRVEEGLGIVVRGHVVGVNGGWKWKRRLRGVVMVGEGEERKGS